MGSEAAVFIRENFYVDDGLKSASTVSDAVEIIQKGTEMCKPAGFRLHKFSSNSKDVLQAIPPDERSKEVKEIDLKNAMLPPERVLGVEWNVENDAFQFRIQLKDKPLTRRGILSTVSSIYDPLGFAAPFLLRGKKILQFLCKDNLGWDDPIPNVLRSQWERWRGELRLLESLEVPRCFKPEGMQELKKVELHHFSDTSTEGYGQCTYLRLVDNNNLVNCSLVIGKARVTPLKPVTVPRLELTAALVSVRVSSMLSRELRYNGVEEIFCTDSKVVQSYISNDARRFHTYVANRVQQIRDHTKPTQWKYVESEHNPTDDASRGLSPKNLTRSSRWIRGPDFLWEHHDSWKNVGDDTPEALSSDDKEVKESSALSTTAKAKERLASILQRLQYFSDWFCAKRAIANCIRYIKILQARVQRRKSRETDCSKVAEGTLTVEELKRIEQMIVKLTKSEAFVEELTVLKDRPSKAKEEPSERGRRRTNTLPRTSPLYRLDPFVESQGLLRVGARIREASIAYEVKHPLKLPRVGHVSHLIAKHFHETTKHQGRGFTVNEVQSSGYWIVGCSTVVAKLIEKCVACRRLRATTQDQKMASLPEDRLEPTQPFIYCGVGYFGHGTSKKDEKS